MGKSSSAGAIISQAYYNDLTKLGSVRLNKHRQLIHDLKFTDKYLAGKKNPTDYASRRAHGIEHLTQEQRERLQEWIMERRYTSCGY